MAKQDFKAAVAAIEIKKEKYQIPGTDLVMLIHGLTSRQLEQWRADSRDPEVMDPNLAAASILQKSLHDEDGEQIFDETEILFLADRPASFLEPMVEIAKQLNGQGLGSYEAIVKNLLRILGASGLHDLLASIGAPCPKCAQGTAPTNSPSSTSLSNDGPPEKELQP